MNTIPHLQRYLPHKLETKFYATKLYRSGCSIIFICRRYHISKSSSMIYGTNICYTGNIPQKFYQYTMPNDASRERFIYPYMEQSSYSTIDFKKNCIDYFGYIPQIYQSDNGSEFTHAQYPPSVATYNKYGQGCA